MIWIYIFLIALAAFPLLLTIQRMRRAAHIKKNGVHVNAIVRQIKTLRTSKSTMDILILEYKERATGRPYNAKATVTHQKFKTGDSVPVAYLPDKPSKYAIDLKSAYWVVLIFCILLFLFVLFAVYKINEMVKTGNM
ncbi:MAG: DUF3592 domain-containing protein [Bacteroidota bacterium]